MYRNFPSSRVRKPLFWISLLVLSMLALAACQPATPSQAAPAPTNTSAPTTAPVPTMAPTQTAAPASAAMEEPVVSVANDPNLGQILVDSKGMTLYVFAKDAPDQSNCTEGCLKAWPPLVSEGSPKAGDGVDAAMLGTTTLGDGSQIVTYNHMPLYYFAKDTKAGDTNGQDVNQVWFVVSPDGKAVGMSSVPATGSDTAAAAGTVNVASNATLGQILVDSKGMTLYMFKKDEPDKSNCSANCLKAWPPLTIAGEPKAGDGVDPSLLGLAKLDDGSQIVTYNHMPLYYFAKDTQPGDTNGQEVNDVWYVVAPNGEPVEEAPSSDSAAMPAEGDVTVAVADNATLGQILVDGKGLTLYMFTKDAPNQSNCTGGCLKLWPPLHTSSQAVAADGVDASALGTADMPDGTKIVTYHEMPLYYWAGDTKPGDVSGQGVNSSWFVVSPDGKPVGMEPASGY